MRVAVPAFELSEVETKVVTPVAFKLAPDDTLKISNVAKSVTVSVPNVILKVSIPLPPVNVSLPDPPVMISTPELPMTVNPSVWPVRFNVLPELFVLIVSIFKMDELFEKLKVPDDN